MASPIEIIINKILWHLDRCKVQSLQKVQWTITTQLLDGKKKMMKKETVFQLKYSAVHLIQTPEDLPNLF